MIFDKFIEFYKIYRGKTYYRIALFALTIPLAIFSTSLIDLILKFLSIQLDIPDLFILPVTSSHLKMWHQTWNWTALESRSGGGLSPNPKD